MEPFRTPEEKAEALRKLLKEIAKLLVGVGCGAAVGGYLGWCTLRMQARMLAYVFGVPVGKGMVAAALGLNSLADLLRHKVFTSYTWQTNGGSRQCL